MSVDNCIKTRKRLKIERTQQQEAPFGPRTGGIAWVGGMYGGTFFRLMPTSCPGLHLPRHPQ